MLSQSILVEELIAFISMDILTESNLLYTTVNNKMYCTVGKHLCGPPRCTGRRDAVQYCWSTVVLLESAFGVLSVTEPNPFYSQA